MIKTLKNGQQDTPSSEREEQPSWPSPVSNQAAEAQAEAARRPVQAKGDVAKGSETQSTAAEGVAGPADKYPHQAAIESAFERPIAAQAHTGAAAQEATGKMGAEAFATGNQVAFSSASPSLHTAAHEAVHTLQQAGGVQLAGGVGEEGDEYEDEADEIADKVVAGEKVGHLLPTGEAKGEAAEAPVQLKRKVTSSDRTENLAFDLVKAAVTAFEGGDITIEAFLKNIEDAWKSANKDTRSAITDFSKAQKFGDRVAAKIKPNDIKLAEAEKASVDPKRPAGAEAADKKALAAKLVRIQNVFTMLGKYVPAAALNNGAQTTLKHIFLQCKPDTRNESRTKNDTVTPAKFVLLKEHDLPAGQPIEVVGHDDTGFTLVLLNGREVWTDDDNLGPLTPPEQKKEPTKQELEEKAKAAAASLSGWLDQLKAKEKGKATLDKATVEKETALIVPDAENAREPELKQAYYKYRASLLRADLEKVDPKLKGEKLLAALKAQVDEELPETKAAFLADPTNLSKVSEFDDMRDHPEQLVDFAKSLSPVESLYAILDKGPFDEKGLYNLASFEKKVSEWAASFPDYCPKALADKRINGKLESYPNLFSVLINKGGSGSALDKVRKSVREYVKPGHRTQREDFIDAWNALQADKAAFEAVRNDGNFQHEVNDRLDDDLVKLVQASIAAKAIQQNLSKELTEEEVSVVRPYADCAAASIVSSLNRANQGYLLSIRKGDSVKNVSGKTQAAHVLTEYKDHVTVVLGLTAPKPGQQAAPPDVNEGKLLSARNLLRSIYAGLTGRVLDDEFAGDAAALSEFEETGFVNDDAGPGLSDQDRLAAHEIALATAKRLQDEFGERFINGPDEDDIKSALDGFSTSVDRRIRDRYKDRKPEIKSDVLDAKITEAKQQLPVAFRELTGEPLSVALARVARQEGDFEDPAIGAREDLQEKPVTGQTTYAAKLTAQEQASISEAVRVQVGIFGDELDDIFVDADTCLGAVQTAEQTVRRLTMPAETIRTPENMLMWEDKVLFGMQLFKQLYEQKYPKYPLVERVNDKVGDINKRSSLLRLFGDRADPTRGAAASLLALTDAGGQEAQAKNAIQYQVAIDGLRENARTSAANLAKALGENGRQALGYAREFHKTAEAHLYAFRGIATRAESNTPATTSFDFLQGCTPMQASPEVEKRVTEARKISLQMLQDAYLPLGGSLQAAILSHKDIKSADKDEIFQALGIDPSESIPRDKALEADLEKAKSELSNLKPEDAAYATKTGEIRLLETKIKAKQRATVIAGLLNTQIVSDEQAPRSFNGVVEAIATYGLSDTRADRPSQAVGERLQELVATVVGLDAKEGRDLYLSAYADVAGISLYEHIGRVYEKPGQAATILGVGESAFISAQRVAYKADKADPTLEFDPQLCNVNFSIEEAEQRARTLHKEIENRNVGKAILLLEGGDRVASAEKATKEGLQLGTGAESGRPEENRIVLLLFKRIFGYELRYLLNRCLDVDEAKRINAVATSAGQISFAEEMRQAPDVDTVYARTMEASADEKAALLKAGDVLADLRAKYGDKAYDRIYRTLSGELTLTDLGRTRDAGKEWYCFGVFGTDEEGFYKDIAAYFKLVKEKIKSEGDEASAEFKAEARKIFSDPSLQKVIDKEFSTDELLKVQQLILGGGEQTEGDKVMVAVEGLGTDFKTVIASLKAMSDEERAAKRLDEDFQKKLVADLSASERAEAFAILFADKGKEYDATLGKAMDGSFGNVDQEKIIDTVLAMDQKELVKLANDPIRVAEIRSKLMSDCVGLYTTVGTVVGVGGGPLTMLEGGATGNVLAKSMNEAKLKQFDELIAKAKNLTSVGPDAKPEEAQESTRKFLIFKHTESLRVAIQKGRDYTLAAAQAVAAEKGLMEKKTPSDPDVFVFNHKERTTVWGEIQSVLAAAEESQIGWETAKNVALGAGGGGMVAGPVGAIAGGVTSWAVQRDEVKRKSEAFKKTIENAILGLGDIDLSKITDPEERAKKMSELADKDPSSLRLELGLQGSDNDEAVDGAIDGASEATLIYKWSNVLKPGESGSSLKDKCDAYLATVCPPDCDASGQPISNSSPGYDAQALAAFQSFPLDASTDFLDIVLQKNNAWHEYTSNDRLLKLKTKLRERLIKVPGKEVATALHLSPDSSDMGKRTAALMLQNSDRRMLTEFLNNKDLYRQQRERGSFADNFTDTPEKLDANYMYLSHSVGKGESEGDLTGNKEEIDRRSAAFNVSVTEYKAAKQAVADVMKWIAAAIISAVTIAVTGGAATGLVATLVIAAIESGANVAIDYAVMGDEYDLRDGARQVIKDVLIAGVTFGAGKAFDAASKSIPMLADLAKAQKAFKQWNDTLAKEAQRNFGKAVLKTGVDVAMEVGGFVWDEMSGAAVSSIDMSQWKYGLNQGLTHSSHQFDNALTNMSEKGWQTVGKAFINSAFGQVKSKITDENKELNTDPNKKEEELPGTMGNAMSVAWAKTQANIGWNAVKQAIDFSSGKAFSGEKFSIEEVYGQLQKFLKSEAAGYLKSTGQAYHDLKNAEKMRDQLKTMEGLVKDNPDKDAILANYAAYMKEKCDGTLAVGALGQDPQAYLDKTFNPLKKKIEKEVGAEGSSPEADAYRKWRLANPGDDVKVTFKEFKEKYPALVVEQKKMETYRDQLTGDYQKYYDYYTKNPLALLNTDLEIDGVLDISTPAKVEALKKRVNEEKAKTYFEKAKTEMYAAGQNLDRTWRWSMAHRDAYEKYLKEKAKAGELDLDPELGPEAIAELARQRAVNWFKANEHRYS